MSYDVYLEVPTGSRAAGGPAMTTVYDRNHTSNTANMWREAGCDIAEFEGKGAVEFGAALERAISEISTKRAYYRKFEPENGWGTVETTLDFLNDLLEACDRHNYAIIHVSR